MHTPTYFYLLGAVVLFLVGSNLWNGISQKLDAYDTSLKALRAQLVDHETTQSEYRKQQLGLQTDIQSKVVTAVNKQRAMETTLKTIQDDVESLLPQIPQPESSPEGNTPTSYANSNVNR